MTSKRERERHARRINAANDHTMSGKRRDRAMSSLRTWSTHGADYVAERLDQWWPAAERPAHQQLPPCAADGSWSMKQIEKFLFGFGRGCRVGPLLVLLHDCDMYDLGPVVRYEWQEEKVVHPKAEEWLFIWEMCGGDEAMSAAERAALDAMPETITVYRGVYDPAHSDGLSWTTDRAVAERFAGERAGATIITGKVNKRDVFAYLIAGTYRREEFEIVVDPAKVFDRTMESVAPQMAMAA